MSEPIEEPEEVGTRSRMDDELKVMSAIIRQLNELDEAARGRVMAYLAARYAK